LQQQKIAQDNFQRMQDRMFDIGKMNLANQFQAQRDARMINANQDLFKARVEAENKQFMERRELAQQDLDAKIQRDWVQQSTMKTEMQANDVRGMMAQQKYTPQGQKIYGQLSGALRAIEAQRDNLRPAEYSKLLNKWLDDAERAGLDQHIAPPPTVDDRLATGFKDLGTGYGAFMQPDGTIDVRVIDDAKVAANKASAAGEGPEMTAADYFANDTKYEAGKKRVIDAMRQKYMDANPDATTAPEFSADEIHDQMLKEFEQHQQFVQGLRGKNQQQGAAPTDNLSPPVAPPGQQGAPPQVPPQATVAAPVSGGTGQGVPLSRTAAENDRRAQEGIYAGPRDENGRVRGATMDDLRRAIENHPELAQQGVDNIIKQIITDEAVSEMAMAGSFKDPRDALIDYYVDQLTPDMPKPPTPVKVTEIKDATTRTQAAMLPRPKTGEELADMLESGKLQPGDMFVAPDGTMQRVEMPTQAKPQ